MVAETHPPMRIAIVGAGAVGLFYGARLHVVGHEVHFLVRGDYEVLCRDGLKIESEELPLHLPEVRAATTSSGIGPVDGVIITLKSTSNEALSVLLPPLLGPETWVLTLQNGLGNEEFLQSMVPAARILGGVCFVCLNRIAPGVVSHLRHGAVEIAEWSADAPAVRVSRMAAALHAGGISCAISDSLAATRWKKLVWNIPFNGMAITAGCVGVDVLLRPPWRDPIAELMREVIAAAAGEGVRIPPEVIAEQLEKTAVMGGYRPSSLVDYERGRPVEIESIWGEPLRRAQAAGIDVPRLESLYTQLRALHPWR